MNIKPAMKTLTVLIAAAAFSPVHAQNGGLRIVQAQTQASTSTTSVNPVQGMTTPPIQAVVGSPILPLGGGIPVPQQPQHGYATYSNNVVVLAPGDTVFVPTGTMIIENVGGSYVTAPAAPGKPGTPQSPNAPSGGRGGNVQSQRTDRTPNSPNAAPQDSQKTDTSRLAVGTPRDKVVEKYGSPVAYMMNMNGETLYFNGGVVVFIRDGVVATPGK